MQTILDDEFTRVDVELRDSDSVVICFSGAQLGFLGGVVKSAEFYKSAPKSSYIYVADKKVSFGNNLDFGKIFEAIKPYTDGRSLRAIGNSHGGFLALHATNYQRFDTVVTFVPTHTIREDIITESTWSNFVISNIEKWRLTNLSLNNISDSIVYIYHGGASRDRGQFSLFPDRENIHKMCFVNEVITQALLGADIRP